MPDPLRHPPAGSGPEVSPRKPTASARLYLAAEAAAESAVARPDRSPIRIRPTGSADATTPVGTSEVGKVCPNPLAPGLGQLECVWENFKAGGRAALDDLASRSLLYAKARLGTASGQASVNGQGKYAVEHGGEIANTGGGVEIGLRHTLRAPEEGSTLTSYALPIGPKLKKLGGASVSVTADVERDREGYRHPDNIGVAFGASLPAIKLPWDVEVSRASKTVYSCEGTLCPPATPREATPTRPRPGASF